MSKTLNNQSINYMVNRTNKQPRNKSTVTSLASLRMSSNELSFIILPFLVFNFVEHVYAFFFIECIHMAQSAGVVEYTDCIFAAVKDFSNECPDYDTKQSDSKAPVMVELWRMHIIQRLPSVPGLL